MENKGKRMTNEEAKKCLETIDIQAFSKVVRYIKNTKRGIRI